MLYNFMKDFNFKEGNYGSIGDKTGKRERKISI